MRTGISIASVLLLAISACGSSPGAADDDDDDDVPADAGEPIVADPLTWTYLEVPGTTCIDGTVSGFAVNLNPDSTKLFIYLEGGGACFNGFCDSLFTWSGNTPGPSGIFDRADEANPVGDWNMIYVPYCTGDIYAGDNDVELGGSMRSFHGYSNFTAFLNRWVPGLPGIDEVVLSGSSAGGFGAFTNYAQTQRAFGDVPVALIDDSAPAMTSEVFPPCLQKIFRETWGLDSTLLAECGSDCDDPDDYVRDYLDHVRGDFPDARGGVFSSMQDNTIRLFAGYGWYGGWNMCAEVPTSVTGAVYTAGLEELREHLQAGGGDFSSYYVAGNGHTILRTNGFYSTTVAGGTTPAQWFANTINGEAAHLGP